MHQQPHFDHRIREFAYQIWESEGKPDGQAERHWDMARQLAEAQNLGQELLNGDAKPKATRTRKKADAGGDVGNGLTAQETTAKVSKKAAADKAEKPVKEAKADKPAKAEKAVKAAKADAADKPKKPKKAKATDNSEATESLQ